MTGKIYVIGAGLAGLSAATILAGRGPLVTVFEGASQAGGRCRSYFDNTLDTVIDNGNHLVLSGNRAVKDYVARIGSLEGLVGPPDAEFAFVDLEKNQRWCLRPNDGALPFWMASARNRVPDTRLADYAQYLPLLWANKKARIGEVVKDRGPLWRQLMYPFLLAVLNTEPDGSSAALAGAVLRETLARGGRFIGHALPIPAWPRSSWSQPSNFWKARAPPFVLDRACEVLHAMSAQSWRLKPAKRLCRWDQATW